MATRSKSKKTRKSSRGRSAQMVFTRRNYVLLVVGVVLIVVGYTMMRIDNQVDGFVSLYVAPLIILGGYLEIIYAILWRPKEVKDAEVSAAGSSSKAS